VKKVNFLGILRKGIRKVKIKCLKLGKNSGNSVGKSSRKEKYIAVFRKCCQMPTPSQFFSLNLTGIQQHGNLFGVSLRNLK
jgi:hypothetical protein